MQIPSTLTSLAVGLRKLPAPKRQDPPPEGPEQPSNPVTGIVGGLAGGVIGGVGLTGTILRQSVPFQIKAQKDLWSSDRSTGSKLAWSAGLVAINTAALALSPLIGLAVGGFYGYKAGSQAGIGAAIQETTGTLSMLNGLMSDTFRDKARKEDGELQPPSAETVKVQFVTQDPSVTPPIVADLPKSMMGPDLSNSRIVVEDADPFIKGDNAPSKANPSATPDANGNYLFEPGTTEFQQVQSFVSANLALNMYEKALGRKLPWAFEGPLMVHPHAGEGFNAFYGRQIHSVNFFDGQDNVQGKTIHGSESLDVTSHEVGHAVLDAVKPGLMSWFSGIEGPAFHESFGDITAILTALQQDSVVDQVVAETGGDLHKPNLVARLAEEMSLGINNEMLHGEMPQSWVMRDANNDLKYQDPATLPAKPDNFDQLFREPHSFSRIFTGAFWDVLSAVNESFLAKGDSPKQALIETRDAMTNLVAHTLDLTPNRLKHLSQVAEAMLDADKRYNNGQFQEQISKAMQGRDLLPGGGGGDRGQAPKLQMGDFQELASADAWRLQQADKLPGAGEDLKAEAVWKNEQGETFVRFTGVKEVDLDPKTVTDLGASLTLGFDTSGQMFHTQWEPVDRESIELARNEVNGWKAVGGIRKGAASGFAAGSQPKIPDLSPQNGRAPIGYAIPVTSGKGFVAGGAQKMKIVRVPSSSC